MRKHHFHRSSRFFFLTSSRSTRVLDLVILQCTTCAGPETQRLHDSSECANIFRQSIRMWLILGSLPQWLVCIVRCFGSHFRRSCGLKEFSEYNCCRFSIALDTFSKSRNTLPTCNLTGLVVKIILVDRSFI